MRRRLEQHRTAPATTFTGRYRLDVLVYFEEHRYILNAIAREKEINGWRRERKLALIDSMNPKWKDLGPQDSLGDPSPPEGGSG